MMSRDRLEELYNEQSLLEKRLEILKLDILVAKDEEDTEEWEYLKSERKQLRDKLKLINDQIEKEEEELEKQNKNMPEY